MPVHTVTQGEHLSRIAEEAGFADFRVIWDHPQNAALKRNRRNPNVLLPGDEVYIPERGLREESRPTGRRHRFRLEGEALKLRLTIKDSDDRPLADAPCELRVGNDVHELATDSSGRIEHNIPRTAESALLVFKVPPVPFELLVPIQIGHLDPIEEVSGQQARLTNLGYYAGEGGDAEALQFRSAVEEFQCDHGLTVDGICGPRTQAKLKEEHGC